MVRKVKKVVLDTIWCVIHFYILLNICSDEPIINFIIKMLIELCRVLIPLKGEG